MPQLLEMLLKQSLELLGALGGQLEPDSLRWSFSSRPPRDQTGLFGTSTRPARCGDAKEVAQATSPTSGPRLVRVSANGQKQLMLGRVRPTASACCWLQRRNRRKPVLSANRSS